MKRGGTSLMAREPRQLRRDWLRACDAYVAATLAHTRYLRTKGRLADPESAKEIAALEEEHVRLRLRLGRLEAEPETSALQLRLPQDPRWVLSLATRREVLRYREAVCEDSRRLRARSDALVRQSRAARRLRVLGGAAGAAGAALP
jgi:hypothetical protein